MLLGKLPLHSDLLNELNRIVREHRITDGTLQVIGSLERATLGFYEQWQKSYRELSFPAPHEIVAGNGTISLQDGIPFVNLHLAIGDAEGRSFGGHCLEGCRVFAVEFAISPFKGEAPRRVLDETTGLHLLERDIYDTEAAQELPPDILRPLTHP